MNKKKLKYEQAGGGKTCYDCVKEELKVLQKLEHPNIIWLHEIIDDRNKDNMYLVTQWLTQGTLGDLVAKKNKKYELKNKYLVE